MRRMDEALKLAFQMPHKPHKSTAKKTPRESKVTSPDALLSRDQGAAFRSSKSSAPRCVHTETRAMPGTLISF